MKAAFIKAPYQVAIRDIATPEPGPGEVLLKVKMVGLCGTDLHLANAWAGDWTRFGHETVAAVEAVGDLVDDLRVGDLVCVRGTTMCGSCRFCMAGQPQFCTGYGATRLGIGLAEYLVAPRRSVWPVDGLDTVAASLIEPLAVALDVIATADVQISDTVGIVGPGPIGVMCIKLAKLRGARRVVIVGTAADAARFELCRDLGADACVNVAEQDPLLALQRETGAAGLDRIIVTAPPAAVPGAVAMGRYGAVVSFVGFAESDADAKVTLDLNALHRSKIQLRFASSAPVAPFSLANELLATGHFPVERIVTHVLPLAELGDGLRLAGQHADGVVKVSIKVSQ